MMTWLMKVSCLITQSVLVSRNRIYWSISHVHQWAPPRSGIYCYICPFLELTAALHPSTELDAIEAACEIIGLSR